MKLLALLTLVKLLALFQVSTAQLSPYYSNGCMTNDQFMIQTAADCTAAGNSNSINGLHFRGREVVAQVKKPTYYFPAGCVSYNRKLYFNLINTNPGWTSCSNSKICLCNDCARTGSCSTPSVTPSPATEDAASGSAVPSPAKEDADSGSAVPSPAKEDEPSSLSPSSDSGNYSDWFITGIYSEGAFSVPPSPTINFQSWSSGTVIYLSNSLWEFSVVGQRVRLSDTVNSVDLIIMEILYKDPNMPFPTLGFRAGIVPGYDYSNSPVLKNANGVITLYQLGPSENAPSPTSSTAPPRFCVATRT